MTDYNDGTIHGWNGGDCRPLAGIALTAAAERRVEMFRQALIEATQEIEE